MDEHPGDTLGKRFLTFWGALAAIVAVAILLLVYRWIAIPSDTAVNDGGAGKERSNTLTGVQIEQRKELETASVVEAGKTVRLPATAIVPYAATVLATRTAAPSPIKTPAAVAAAAAKVHDPAASKFEGK